MPASVVWEIATFVFASFTLPDPSAAAEWKSTPPTAQTRPRPEAPKETPEAPPRTPPGSGFVLAAPAGAGIVRPLSVGAEFQARTAGEGPLISPARMASCAQRTKPNSLLIFLPATPHNHRSPPA